MSSLTKKRIISKLERLWKTKNKDDEWWSSFVTSPIAIGLNTLVVDWQVLTPNRITSLSFLCATIATICIFMGSYSFFIVAAILINLSHVLDCMDGQMAKYRGVSSAFGSYYDKVTDQLKIFMFFFAASFVCYQQTSDEKAILLGFTGVAFYFIRVYVKYLTIFIEMENDSLYLENSSKVAHSGKPQGVQAAGLNAGFQNNFIWFLKEQRKFFLFNEAVFIFLISLGLLGDLLMEVLWVFAGSQVYYGVLRSWQRGYQIYKSQHQKLLKPLEK